MIDTLRWLLLLEIVGLAFLPLTTRILRILPDRGYAAAKMVGLLLITWITWLIGSVLPVGDSSAFMWLIAAMIGLISWITLRSQVLTALWELRRIVALEEVLFVAAFLGWALMRSFHPDIAGTEKPMDMMLLQASSHAASFPPQDLWLAGFSVNYYYFGYLLMAVAGHMAGTVPWVTYNLALALIFAAAVSLTYSITFNLTRSVRWAVLGPVFVVLLGNDHSLFFQIIHGQFPWNSPSWYWESSRVVGETAPGAATTINEFPFFSLVLGDLHPHVLAIPTVLLAITGALALVYREPASGRQSAPLILLLAIIVGSLAATNSWDYPTYLLLAVVAVLVPRFGKAGQLGGPRGAPDPVQQESGDPRLRQAVRSTYGRALTEAVALGAVSFLAFIPFYLRFRSPTNGIGRVTTITNPGQFMQMFGFFCILVSVYLVRLAWESGAFRSTVLLPRQPLPEAGAMTLSPEIRRAVTSAALPVLLVGAAALFGVWVAAGSLAVIVGVTALLRTRQVDGNRADRFGLLLIGMAAAVILGTESLYVRDLFDGTPFYRMNTVFKFYFQAWILLGLASAYAAHRVWKPGGVKQAERRLVLAALLASGLLVGGVYTVLAPISYYGALQGGPVTLASHGLDGLQWMRSTDRSDYFAIRWMQTHIHGNPVVLEAVGGDYSLFGRVSTYTGLPTLLGWQGHEEQWRTFLPILAARHALVDRIYSTGSIKVAEGQLVQNHVRLVYVGPCERETYGTGPQAEVCGSTTHVSSAADALTKFRRFMTTIYDRDGVTIYRL
ncbi:MAG TPA: DUF2298 domain-containing protein [Chloroflexota bacterium]|nr:DUF2298 domain-containing protein [Chloroflexota bacterium]